MRTHWKRSHITVSNIDTQVKSHYQPEEKNVITTNIIRSRVVDNGKDKHGMGRWWYITING